LLKISIFPLEKRIPYRNPFLFLLVMQSRMEKSWSLCLC